MKIHSYIFFKSDNIACQFLFLNSSLQVYFPFRVTLNEHIVFHKYFPKLDINSFSYDIVKIW